MEKLTACFKQVHDPLSRPHHLVLPSLQCPVLSSSQQHHLPRRRKEYVAAHPIDVKVRCRVAAGHTALTHEEPSRALPPSLHALSPWALPPHTLLSHATPPQTPLSLWPCASPPHSPHALLPHAGVESPSERSGKQQREEKKNTSWGEKRFRLPMSNGQKTMSEYRMHRLKKNILGEENNFYFWLPRQNDF
jgi:hypothetical protein